MPLAIQYRLCVVRVRRLKRYRRAGTRAGHIGDGGMSVHNNNARRRPNSKECRGDDRAELADLVSSEEIPDCYYHNGSTVVERRLQARVSSLRPVAEETMIPLGSTRLKTGSCSPWVVGMMVAPGRLSLRLCEHHRLDLGRGLVSWSRVRPLVGQLHPSLRVCLTLAPNQLRGKPR